jgi:molecular chaperone GrpE
MADEQSPSTPADKQPGAPPSGGGATSAERDTQATMANEPRASEEFVESDELKRLRTELEEATDHALRSRAELENYRKRIQREMEEERRYANVRLIRDLLPVLDNVERAITAAETKSDADTLLQGFKMVAQQLEVLLEQYHCKRVDALHCEFDPSVHEAIAQQPSAEHPANTVLHVARSGYRLHDRIVRPSQVVVSTLAPQASSAEKPSTASEDGGGSEAT